MTTTMPQSHATSPFIAARRAHRPGKACFAFAVAVGMTMLLGCGDGRPRMAPVKGVVRYNGKPLAFGGVLFQPESGQPAQGAIQPDGTFVLSTYSENDGASIGTHRVQVSCYESQDPKRTQDGRRAEMSLGRSLIPDRYTYFDTSGIVVEVKGQNDPVVIELTNQ